MRKLLALVPILLCLFASSIQAQEDHRYTDGSGFDAICSHRHFAELDPIGRAMHLHQFSGTRATSNDMTLADLRAGGTNCDRVKDTSGYWIPAVFDTSGNPVTPTRAAAYYRTQVSGVLVVRPPADLRIVAGSATATTPQDTSIVRWDCKDPDAKGGFYAVGSEPQNCAKGQDFPRVQIRFPQCWDGVNKDSYDHKSHMAYPVYVNGVLTCPPAHPVAIPALFLQLNFPSGSEGGPDYSAVYFSSGGRNSMHADWWQGWKENEGGFQDLISRCINAGVFCG